MLSRVLCRGAVQGAPDVCNWVVSGCCPECSGSCLPLGGVRVLSRVLFRVLRIMFAIGRCQGAVQGVQGAPDHVCDWVVSELSRVLSRVLSKVLSRVLRIMFASGRCQGAVQGAVRVLRIMFVRVLCRGVVQGAPDHVCHWAVSGFCPACSPGCCPGCSGSCLPVVLSGVLSNIFRIMFARALSSGAVQGAPDHVCYWAVSGCCQFNVLISIWGLCWCNSPNSFG